MVLVACCKTDEFGIGKLNQLNFKYDIASLTEASLYFLHIGQAVN